MIHPPESRLNADKAADFLKCGKLNYWDWCLDSREATFSLLNSFGIAWHVLDNIIRYDVIFAIY